MEFYLKSILLGIGLAMDACAVSMANGMREPKMRIDKILLIAFMFGLFQGLMPLIGYLIGHALLSIIEEFIPWIALLLLGFIGGKMVYEGFKKDKEDEEKIVKLTFLSLFIQSIATSIDALSVGFTFADYTITDAIICSSLIMIVTFLISFFAVFIGKKFGDALGKKAEILGGIILILIGVEIFITSII